jgi:hypothetical protein
LLHLHGALRTSDKPSTRLLYSSSSMHTCEVGYSCKTQMTLHDFRTAVREQSALMAFGYRRPLGTPGTSPASRHQQYGKKAEVC